MLFLEKMDINGDEMHDLFKFFKRQTSSLFVPRYGMASRIYDYHTKFLCNRYGEVKKYYGSRVEMAIIEADIKDLIKEKFDEKKYKNLIEPVDMYEWHKSLKSGNQYG